MKLINICIRFWKITLTDLGTRIGVLFFVPGLAFTVLVTRVHTTTWEIRKWLRWMFYEREKQPNLLLIVARLGRRSDWEYCAAILSSVQTDSSLYVLCTLLHRAQHKVFTYLWRDLSLRFWKNHQRHSLL